MNTTEKYAKRMFILFPALAMLLGWGLRGHIGGGPFGAMIPGALVALTICMLLELPAKTSAIIVVFGVVGIGLGGEMTYGQTLGFLRNPETVWWGTLGTTLKGSIWGLLGATVLSLGFLSKKLKQKTIALALLLMMAGMFLGFKLINEPMLIYFSDPANPRSESWAALLFGAVAILIYLRFTIKSEQFRIVTKFALFGLLGGGLGFGLGGFWMVLGNKLGGEIIFRSWWKMMEFTFGFLLGAFLGYTAWLVRKELKTFGKENQHTSNKKLSTIAELGIVLLAGLLIYWIIPAILEPVAGGANENEGVFINLSRGLAGIVVNYAFFGFILILLALRLPSIAWQLGITLTFCHTMIDLGRDHIVKVVDSSPQAISVIAILITTVIVAWLTSVYRKKENAKLWLFLLLVWSTVFVSKVKILFSPKKLELAGMSFCEIVCGTYIVDIIFLISAIIVTLIATKNFKIVNQT
jgi:hypothetical protein